MKIHDESQVVWKAQEGSQQYFVDCPKPANLEDAKDFQHITLIQN